MRCDFCNDLASGQGYFNVTGWIAAAVMFAGVIGFVLAVVDSTAGIRFADTWSGVKEIRNGIVAPGGALSYFGLLAVFPAGRPQRGVTPHPSLQIDIAESCPERLSVPRMLPFRIGQAANGLVRHYELPANQGHQ